MKKLRPLLLLLITVGMIAASSSSAYCQAQCHLLQANNTTHLMNSPNMSYWFGIMELPFLFISVFFAFLTAYALRPVRQRDELYGLGIPGDGDRSPAHADRALLRHQYFQDCPGTGERLHRMVRRIDTHLGSIWSRVLVDL